MLRCTPDIVFHLSPFRQHRAHCDRTSLVGFNLNVHLEMLQLFRLPLVNKLKYKDIYLFTLTLHTEHVCPGKTTEHAGKPTGMNIPTNVVCDKLNVISWDHWLIIPTIFRV